MGLVLNLLFFYVYGIFILNPAFLIPLLKNEKGILPPFFVSNWLPSIDCSVSQISKHQELTPLFYTERENVDFTLQKKGRARLEPLTIDLNSGKVFGSQIAFNLIKLLHN